MPALLTGSQGKEDARHAKDLGDLLVIPVLGNYVLPFAEPRGLQHTRLHPLKPAGGAGDPHAPLPLGALSLVPRWVCRGVSIWGNPLLLSFEAFAKEKPKTCNSI